MQSDQSKTTITPEMIEAGCSAGWGVGEGRVSVAQVTAIYAAMRALEPHPDAAWHEWVAENVPKGVWPRGPFR